MSHAWSGRLGVHRLAALHMDVAAAGPAVADRNNLARAAKIVGATSVGVTGLRLRARRDLFWRPRRIRSGSPSRPYGRIPTLLEVCGLPEVGLDEHVLDPHGGIDHGPVGNQAHTPDHGVEPDHCGRILVRRQRGGRPRR